MQRSGRLLPRGFCCGAGGREAAAGVYEICCSRWGIDSFENGRRAESANKSRGHCPGQLKQCRIASCAALRGAGPWV
eukprot:s2319_g9.t1